MDAILKNLKTVFVTGTDTGVGKSIFSALLALSYLQENIKVAILKPVQTGSPKDTEFLSSLVDNKIPVFNSYDFKLGAAPSVASKLENTEIKEERIITDIKKLEKKYDLVIVEGIGGITVPIKSNYLVSDLIKDLNYPVVVVSRPSLGTINHTILTLEFAKKENLNILGYVISGYDENTKDPVVKTAPEEISNVSNIKCLMKLPFFAKINHESLLKVIESMKTMSR